MPNDLLERLEQPEYTGENRCTPCTILNLLIAAGVSALVGRRNRALGLLTFVASAALVSLRGYLVPGTPELTKRYLPQSVLAAFDKADPPGEDVPVELAEQAAARADETADSEEDDDSVTSEPSATESVEVVDESDAVAAEADDAEPEVLPEREDVEDLMGQPMEEVLSAFGVVRPTEEGDDLELVDSFRVEWEDAIEALSEEDERVETLADLFQEDEAAVEIETREDGRYYGLVDGKAQYNWITEAALISDLAAHRAVASEDRRWSVLLPEERLSVLKGFRVFLETCPECGGPIAPTDESVESCCQSWEVIAVECADCGARVLELPAPDGRNPNEGGAGAAGVPGGFTR
ncbi:hypothetical protein GJ631_03985 [Natronomonas sp. CBA1123]|uniref:hypothetical protein n=1 Tax=Natronomonas sp. CBA1123 TaxID=2668070 RepID=UPI0012EAA7EF|nr:hypothetical protein [Natronomonas sp. CBA1123]MUV85752.1 hypothetical protein [Natronomonas sp. CBA1123]